MARLAGTKFCFYCSTMDQETADLFALTLEEMREVPGSFGDPNRVIDT